MASAVNPITSSGGAAGSSSSSATSSSTDANQEVFLQLLVSQLKNQDPLNPTDSTQFVSELAQFSELEQVIGIRADIETYHTQATAQASNSGDQTPATGQTQP